MTKACRVCAEHKPQYHKLPQAHLIKATESFERLNPYFKGPLKPNNRNILFFNAIVEYSRFPFCLSLQGHQHTNCHSMSISAFLYF